MFRSWIVRQCNRVWVCKLADIVTSLCSVICTRNQANVIHIWNQHLIKGVWMQIFIELIYDGTTICRQLWRTEKKTHHWRYKLTALFTKPLDYLLPYNHNSHQRPFPHSRPMDFFLFTWIILGKSWERLCRRLHEYCSTISEYELSRSHQK